MTEEQRYKTVHKLQFYPSQTAARFSMPERFKVVGFDMQQEANAPAFWFERPNEQQDWVQWEVRIVGTGELYDEDFEYLGSPLLIGPYVFHLVGRRARG